MATKWQKQVKAQLGASVADRVICHADGSVTARRTFFYTGGATSSDYLDRVQSTLKAAGIQTSGESDTRWAADAIERLAARVEKLALRLEDRD